MNERNDARLTDWEDPPKRTFWNDRVTRFWWVAGILVVAFLVWAVVLHFVSEAEAQVVEEDGSEHGFVWNETEAPEVWAPVLEGAEFDVFTRDSQAQCDGTQAYVSKKTYATLESVLGTDLARGHLKMAFCDRGPSMKLLGSSAKTTITAAGEWSGWSGNVTAKGRDCTRKFASWLSGADWCEIAVWWAKYRFGAGFQSGFNTEYMKLRIRCNYQRECSAAARWWG